MKSRFNFMFAVAVCAFVVWACSGDTTWNPVTGTYTTDDQLIADVCRESKNKYQFCSTMEEIE